MKTPIAGSSEMARSDVTRLGMIRKALLVCGIGTSLIWLGTDILAALLYEGYRYPLDPISDLSAVDAPTRPFVLPFVGIYIVLKIAFSVGVWVSTGQNRALQITAGLLLAFGLTDLASCFFPWQPAEPLGTFTNTMHAVLAGGLAVLLIMLTIGFGASADGKWFRFYSYGTLLVMIVMGALPLLGGVQLATDQPPEWFGAGERINAYGFMLWMMVLAIVLLQHRTEELAA